MYELINRQSGLENEISDYDYSQLPHHKQLKYRHKASETWPSSSSTQDNYTPPMPDFSPTPDYSSGSSDSGSSSSFDFGGGDGGGAGASGSYDSGGSDSGSSDCGSGSSD